jgi:hypothetical protein
MHIKNRRKYSEKYTINVVKELRVNYYIKYYRFIHTIDSHYYTAESDMRSLQST